MTEIIRLTSTVEVQSQFQLTALLINCVDNDASIGFIPPLSQTEALRYWQGVEADLQKQTRVLWTATINHQIVGAIQLSFCMKKNGLHRAEVEKLMVHTDHRGKGIGRQLLAKIEQCALNYERSLLVLDTRTGDVASDLYRSAGYVEVGQIPQFVTNREGQFEATTYFYKILN